MFEAKNLKYKPHLCKFAITKANDDNKSEDRVDYLSRYHYTQGAGFSKHGQVRKNRVKRYRRLTIFLKPFEYRHI